MIGIRWRGVQHALGASIAVWGLLGGGFVAAESVHSMSSGTSQLNACANAKHHAIGMCRSGIVEGFGECLCEQGQFRGGDSWQCAVDARCASSRQGAMQPDEGMHTSGATVGPPDGVVYEVVSQFEVLKPAVQCGFNRLSFPNPGVFAEETRVYREYRNGQVVRSWQDSFSRFERCHRF